MTARIAPHPFSQSHWQQIEQLLRTLDEHQATWLSGYLAARGEPRVTPVAETSRRKILIAFGSETGNSEALARELAGEANDAGIAAQVEDLANLRLRQLAKRDYLIVICSTHGDGDPPEPIGDFYEALMSENAPALSGLSYAVLALGDSSYEHYCVTGRQLDRRLEALGAKRLLPCQDCDVDFAQPAREWRARLLPLLPTSAEQAPGQAAGMASEATTQQQYDKHRPLSVEVLNNLRLSDAGRASPIHHLELALESVDFPILPGDAVGVLADNPPALVASILDTAGLSGERPVKLADSAMPLVEALRQHLDLTVPGPRFLDTWAALSGAEELLALREADGKARRAFLREHQLRDLIGRYPATPDPQALVDSLRPLQPRLYDVANSLTTVEDELHLTIKDFTYRFGERQERGIASQYLLALQAGDSVRVYPHRNKRFRLPDDPDTPLILIAEGTGIAPYRAFLQALAVGERYPACWLVFAEQRFEEDFLYQLDLQRARQAGVLERVDTVFYRDQPERLMSDPLLDQAETFTAWLERGAHVYLCGDKTRLTQCESTLEALCDQHSGKGHWKRLAKDKRIHRNLY